jgi:hypothetical protein
MRSNDLAVELSHQLPPLQEPHCAGLGKGWALLSLGCRKFWGAFLVFLPWVFSERLPICLKLQDTHYFNCKRFEGHG